MRPNYALLTCLALTSLTLSSAARAAGPGRDFTPEAKLLFRVVACTGDESIPEHLDRKVIDAYCRRLEQHMASYRKNYVEDAAKFITAARPADAPKVLVYPFGGGDLMSALTTYPDATDITTMSLEHAGDPRRIMTLKKGRLEPSLGFVRGMAAGLLLYNDSTSETLMKAQQNDLPGQVSLFLIALATHGYEPVSLRFFKLEDDGSIHYYDDAEIAALEKTKADHLKPEWTPPDFSEAFSNSEITFKKRGAGPDAEVRVHRHFAANLADARLAKTPGLVRFLEKKDRISAMTKAASYLLWRNDFSMIRDYLLRHMDVMISDSTGIPPEFTQKAGFVQETYGTFKTSFLGANEKYNEEFRKVWKSQPYRHLPFRYGYIDGSKQYHMVVTKLGPKDKADAKADKPDAKADKPDAKADKPAAKAGAN